MSFDPNSPWDKDQAPGQFPVTGSPTIQQEKTTDSTANIGTFGVNLATGDVRGLPEVPKFDAQQAIRSVGELTGIDTENIAKSTLGEGIQTLSEIPGIIGDIPVVGDVAKFAAGVTGTVGGKILEVGIGGLGLAAWPLIQMQDFVYENAVTKTRIQRYRDGKTSAADGAMPPGYYGSPVNEALNGALNQVMTGKEKWAKAPWPLSLLPDIGTLNPNDVSYLSSGVKQMIDQGMSDDEVLSSMRENMTLLTDDMYQALLIGILDPLPGYEARLLGKSWRSVQAVADAVRWSEDAGQFAVRMAQKDITGPRLKIAENMKILGKMYNMGSSIISRGYATVTPQHFNAIADTVGETNLAGIHNMAKEAGVEAGTQFVDNLVMDARYQYTVAAKEPTSRIASETAQAFAKKVIVTAANEGVDGLKQLQGFRGYSDEFYQRFVGIADEWKKLPDGEQEKALDVAMDELRLAYNQQQLSQETSKFLQSQNRLQLILRHFGNEIRARVKTVLDVSKNKRLADVSEHLSKGLGASGELYLEAQRRLIASLSDGKSTLNSEKISQGLAIMFADAQKSYGSLGGQQQAIEQLAGVLEIIKMSAHGRALQLLAPLKKVKHFELLTIVRDDRFTMKTLDEAISMLGDAIKSDSADSMVKTAEALVSSYTELGSRFSTTIFSTLLKESPKEKASEVLDMLHEIRNNKGYVSRISQKLESQLDLLQNGPGDGLKYAAQVAGKTVDLNDLLYGGVVADLETSDIISTSQDQELFGKYLGKYIQKFDGEISPELWSDSVYADAPAFQKNLWNHNENDLDASLYLGKLEDALTKNNWIDPKRRRIVEGAHQGLTRLPNIIDDVSALEPAFSWSGINSKYNDLYHEVYGNPTSHWSTDPLPSPVYAAETLTEYANPFTYEVVDAATGETRQVEIEGVAEWYSNWNEASVDWAGNSFARSAAIDMNGWRVSGEATPGLSVVVTGNEIDALTLLLRNRLMRLAQDNSSEVTDVTGAGAGIWRHPKIRFSMSNAKRLPSSAIYDIADDGRNYQQLHLVLEAPYLDASSPFHGGLEAPVARSVMASQAEIAKLTPANAQKLLMDPEYLVGRYLSGDNFKDIWLDDVIFHYDKDGNLVRATQLLKSSGEPLSQNAGSLTFDQWIREYLERGIGGSDTPVWSLLGYENAEIAKKGFAFLNMIESQWRVRAIKSFRRIMRDLKARDDNRFASGMYHSIADMFHSLDSLHFSPTRLTTIELDAVHAPRLSDYFMDSGDADSWTMTVINKLDQAMNSGDPVATQMVADAFEGGPSASYIAELDGNWNDIIRDLEPAALNNLINRYGEIVLQKSSGDSFTKQLSEYKTTFSGNKLFHHTAEHLGATADARLIRGLDSFYADPGVIMPVGAPQEFATGPIGKSISEAIDLKEWDNLASFGDEPNQFTISNPAEFLTSGREATSLAKATGGGLHGVVHRVYDPNGSLENAARVIDIRSIKGTPNYPSGDYVLGAFEGRNIRGIKHAQDYTMPGTASAKAAMSAQKLQEEYNTLKEDQNMQKLADVRQTLKENGYVLGNEPEEGFLRTHGIVYDVAGNPVTRPTLQLYTKIDKLLPAESLGLDKPELIKQANSAKAKLVKMLTPVGNNELYDRAVQRLRVGLGGAISEQEAYRAMALMVKEGVEQEISIGGLTKTQIDTILTRAFGGGEKGLKTFRRIFGPGEGGESARKVVLFAISGDLSKIGATTKFSRTIQANYPTLASIANKLYPLARYRYNPYFNAQELVEPYALTLLRGIRGSELRRDSSDLAAILTTPGSFRYDSHELGSHILRYNSSVLDEITKANPLVADAVQSRLSSVVGDAISYLAPVGEKARRRTADIKVAATDWTTYNEVLRASGRQLMREMPDVAKAAMEVLGTTDPAKIFRHLIDSGVNGTIADNIIRIADVNGAPFTFGTAFDFGPMDKVVTILSKPNIVIDDLEQLEDAHIIVSKTGATTKTQKEVADALDEVISSVRSVQTNVPTSVAGDFEGTPSLTTALASDLEKKALRRWSGGDYGKITRYLAAKAETPIIAGIQPARTRDEAAMIAEASNMGLYDENAIGDDRFKKMEEFVANFDSALNRNTVITTSPVYRGADFVDLFAPGYSPKAGDEFRMLNAPAFSRSRSRTFTGSVKLRIENPIGMKGLDLNAAEGLSVHQMETEVMMPRGQMWRIVSAAKRSNGDWEIVIDTVAPRTFTKVAGGSSLNVSYEAQGRLVRALNSLRIEEEGRYQFARTFYRLMETNPILKEYLKKRGIELGVDFKEVKRESIVKRRSFAFAASGDVLPVQPERARVAQTVAKTDNAAVVTDSGLALIRKIEKSDEIKMRPGMNTAGKSGLWEGVGGVLRWVKRPDIGSDLARNPLEQNLHVLNEYMVSEIYRRAGVKVPQTSIIPDVDGLYIGSEWLKDTKRLSEDMKDINVGNAQGFLDNILYDLWLANFDVTNRDMSNVLVDAAGELVRVDFGSSGLYRAGGGLRKNKSGGGDLVDLVDFARWPMGKMPGKAEYGVYNMLRIAEADMMSTTKTMLNMNRFLSMADELIQFARSTHEGGLQGMIRSISDDMWSGIEASGHVSKAEFEEFVQKNIDLFDKRMTQIEEATSLKRAEISAKIKMYEEEQALKRADQVLGDVRTRETLTASIERDPVIEELSNKLAFMQANGKQIPLLNEILVKVEKGELITAREIDALGTGMAQSLYQPAQMQVMMNWAKTAWAEGASVASREQFYSMYKSPVERSLNHPYLGVYPISYMWGKILPAFFNAMFKYAPFEGGFAPFLGAFQTNKISDYIAASLEDSPQLQQYVASRPPLLFFLNGLLPGFPTDVSVSLPYWFRNGIMRPIAKNDLEQIPGALASSVFETAKRSQGWAAGPELAVKAISDIQNFLTGSPNTSVLDNIGDFLSPE